MHSQNKRGVSKGEEIAWVIGVLLGIFIGAVAAAQWTKGNWQAEIKKRGYGYTDSETLEFHWYENNQGSR